MDGGWKVMAEMYKLDFNSLYKLNDFQLVKLAKMLFIECFYFGTMYYVDIIKKYKI